RVQGLLRYLYGPGTNGEHHNPHIGAGFDAAGPAAGIRAPRRRPLPTAGRAPAPGAAREGGGPETRFEPARSR
ncbi:hypothetical protein, partial [Actinomadura sp. NPDC000929]|uniref:hypothetical protein n=1 Tax=Actinomadura sp. NPDC000929 TaxID=3154517 RepID=UPI003396660C